MVGIDHITSSHAPGRMRGVTRHRRSSNKFDRRGRGDDHGGYGSYGGHLHAGLLDHGVAVQVEVREQSKL
jgi:hypothetical protein